VVVRAETVHFYVVALIIPPPAGTVAVRGLFF
jgi:hypothetical protein